MTDPEIDSKLKASYYKEIGVLNEKHGVFIVQRTDSGKLYIKKEVSSELEKIYFKIKELHLQGVPAISDILRDGERLIIYEEYISGQTLEEIIKKRGKLRPQEVTDFAIQLCDILTGLHEMNPPIIHRDIKPSNIIITNGGRVFLIDFDAAKFEKNENRDTCLIGTAGYAAPEQYGFGASTVQTDLYALGILMTEMLTGDTDPSKVSNPKFKKLIQKCVQLDAEKRYASARQLKKALKKKNVAPFIVIGIAAIILILLFMVLRARTKAEAESGAIVQGIAAEETARESENTEQSIIIKEEIKEKAAIEKSEPANVQETLQNEITEEIEEETIEEITEEMIPDTTEQSSVWNAETVHEQREKSIPRYFADEKEFEQALNNGENLEGSSVTFTVFELHPQSAFGYNLWAGEHLNFVSDRHPGVYDGDTLTVKATKISSFVHSWIIEYEKLPEEND